MERFIEEEKLSMKWWPVPMNPNMADDKPDPQGRRWADQAFHYKITLKKGPKSLIVYWSDGSPGDPELDSILENLASDAAGYENNPDFDQWVREYGIEPDEDDEEDPYRRERKTFKHVERFADKFKKFLGEDAYKKLLWEIERE